jgi:membrane peptidoglycan carboxypeptidase
MVGGRNYHESQFNRAAQAQRQPGSAFKLFVYMAALRSGMHLDDTIDASSLEIDGWRPENYGGHEYGTVTLADAFAHSINTAAVHLAQKVGLDQVISAARDLGIDSPLPKVPSLALGSADVTLLNLTSAYAGVLAGQVPVRPWGVASFSSSKTRPMSVGPVTGDQRTLGDLRESLMQLLRLPVERGTAREAALDGFTAGKTGTTQNHKDAWFIGFNEFLIVGVWVGNDDGAPMEEVTGGSLPAVIWKNFMTRAASRHIASQNPVAAPEQAQRRSQIAEAPTPEQKLGETNQAEAQQPQCDYRACAAKYQSFNAMDCTYQPYGGGERKRCEKAALVASGADRQQGATAGDGREDQREAPNADVRSRRPRTIFQLLYGNEQ